LGEPIPRFEAALAEAYAAGLLGKKYLGIGIDFRSSHVRRWGRLHCARKPPLLEVARGQTRQAALKPPFPPTSVCTANRPPINNTQSYASVPTIMRKGEAWFAGLGPPNRRHHDFFPLSGHVGKPGNFELPSDTLKDLLELWAGVKGRKLKAVIPGGVSVPVVPGDAIMGADHGLRFGQKSGVFARTGSVIVWTRPRAMVRTLERNIPLFYMSESCGQCTPWP